MISDATTPPIRVGAKKWQEERKGKEKRKGKKRRLEVESQTLLTKHGKSDAKGKGYQLNWYIGGAVQCP